MDYQKDRQYSLQIGQGKGTGILIENLHLEFRISKGSDNKKRTNKATISIYNLSAQYQAYIEAEFVEVVLSVGYVGLGMHKLFAGQVTVAGTRRQGADIVTELQIESFYTELNHKRITKTLGTGTTIKSVVEAVRDQMGGVSRAVYSGKNIEKKMIDGYSITGSPRQILNELSEAFEMEWQVDDGVLYIQDRGFSYMTDKTKAYVISEMSGLIERPYFDNIEKQRGKKDKLKKARKGVKLKILLNPAIVAGSIVKIEYAEFTGFYKVEKLTHSGGMYSDQWETELVCGTMLNTTT